VERRQRRVRREWRRRGRRYAGGGQIFAYCCDNAAGAAVARRQRRGESDILTERQQGLVRRGRLFFQRFGQQWLPSRASGLRKIDLALRGPCAASIKTVSHLLVAEQNGFTAIEMAPRCAAWLGMKRPLCAQP